MYREKFLHSECLHVLCTPDTTKCIVASRNSNMTCDLPFLVHHLANNYEIEIFLLVCGFLFFKL